MSFKKKNFPQGCSLAKRPPLRRGEAFVSTHLHLDGEQSGRGQVQDLHGSIFSFDGFMEFHAMPLKLPGHFYLDSYRLLYGSFFTVYNPVINENNRFCVETD